MKDYTIITVWGKSVGGVVESQTLYNCAIKFKIKYKKEKKVKQNNVTEKRKR